MKKLIDYVNGNSIISVYDDGTRIIETEDADFVFDFPLNIDIRLSTECPFGLNKQSGKSICSFCHESATVNGIGISYRKGFPIPRFEHPNIVWHVIAGIDTINEIKDLAKHGVKKILILGEKDFGFNKNKVDLKSVNHIDWYRRVYELFKLFDIVSFDNLALEQLNIKRFVKDFDIFYQGEHSFYIDAVEECFKPSSRSEEKTYFNEMSLIEYFRKNEKIN